MFIETFLKPGMVFFDVGAHIGEYSILASRAVGPKGAVHAFEPQEELASLMVDSLHVNRIDNVVINRCAVTDAEGDACFSVRSELSCSSLGSFHGSGDASITREDRIATMTLDAYCSKRRIRPHLIKVDVEGAEVLVLKGAEQLLTLPAAAAPTWVVEYSPTNYKRFGFSGATLINLLKEAGYEAQVLDGAEYSETQNLVLRKC